MKSSLCERVISLYRGFFERYGKNLRYCWYFHWLLSDIRYRIRGYLQRVFSGYRFHQNRDCNRREDLWFVHDDPGRLSGWFSGSALWSHPHPVPWRGSHRCDESAVFTSRSVGPPPRNALSRNIRRQPHGRAGECRICGLSLQPHQRLIHRSSIRGFSSLMTLLPKVIGGYFGKHGGQPGLLRLFFWLPVPWGFRSFC